MVDKNLFIQDLKQVFTVLQELKVIELQLLNLIDKFNQSEENFNLTTEEINLIKQYIDGLKQYVVQNDNTTEIGGNVEIDGNLQVNTDTRLISNVEISGELNVDEDLNVFGDIYLNGLPLNKAKLVARGTIENIEGNSVFFKLNNQLSVNKLYLIKKYEDGIGSFTTTIIDTSNNNDVEPILVTFNIDGTYSLATLHFSQADLSSLDILVRGKDTNDYYFDEETDYIEVYELPFIKEI